MRNQQIWIEKQKWKHNNQNKTNHVAKHKHALFRFFYLKITILKWETNKFEFKNNNQDKTNHIRKQKRAHFWYFCCLKTTILKWEINKLELKNKNQYTIIKAKQTMFENKNMFFSDFLFNNNNLEVRNQQTWIEKHKSIHNNQNKTNHVRKQKKLLSDIFCIKKPSWS